MTLIHVRHKMSSVFWAINSSVLWLSIANSLLSHVCRSMCWCSPVHVLCIVTPPVNRTQGQRGMMAIENVYVSLQPELEDLTGDTPLTFSHPIAMCPDLEVSERMGALL